MSPSLRTRGHAMRSNRTALATALLLSVLAAPAAAQEWAGRGRVRGEVKDDKGKPIAGASIYVRRGVEKIDPANPGDGPEVRTTDDKGRWTVAGITGGEWFALITKEGFQNASGKIQVNEFEIGPPIATQLFPIPQEYLDAQAKAKAMEAVQAAVERGNAALTASDHA